MASFFNVNLKNNDIAEKTTHYIHLSHIIEKPKIVNGETKEKLKKAEFNYMVNLYSLIHKTSVYPKLFQFKIFLQNKQKERASKQNSPVFTEPTERFGLLFARHKFILTDV